MKASLVEDIAKQLEHTVGAGADRVEVDLIWHEQVSR